MTALPRGSDAALTPVRGSLLATAQSQASDIRRDARLEADAVLAAAESEAGRIRADAAAEGEAVARSEAALRSARVRRQAQETVLARRNALRLELQRLVLEAAAALRADPRYPQLVARLTAHGRAVLGPQATATESEDGGVVVAAGSRRLDLSLPALAARSLDSMTEEVRALWTE
jgi:cell division septum initiation protein DivIVA